MLKHSQQRREGLLADVELPVTAQALEAQDSGTAVIDERGRLDLVDELDNGVARCLRRGAELSPDRRDGGREARAKEGHL